MQGIAIVFFITCVAAFRLPNLYKALWEDEVHHHHPILTAPSFDRMRRGISFQNKAILDYAIRRGVFLSGFVDRNERNLHLVSLVFATAHLLLLLLYPWTTRLFPRWIAAFCLAGNSLEHSFSTEAQYYALSSLMGSVVCVALHWALKKMWAGFHTRASVGFLFAAFLSVNTNYFIAPLAAVASAVFGIALLSDDRAPTRRLAGLWAGLVAIGGPLTLWLNKYSLYQTLFHPMAPAQKPTISFTKSSVVFGMNYGLMSIHKAVFGWVSLVSLFNRDRTERWLAFTLAAMLFVAKPLFFTYYAYRSDFPLFDRYTIMYVGPAALMMGLGASSIQGWMDRFRMSIVLKSALLSGLALLIFQDYRPIIESRLTSIPRAIDAWRAAPSNFSREYHFFERVKRLNAPLLVLVDHPWCKDIPLLYLQGGIGAPAQSKQVIAVDTATQPLRAWQKTAENFNHLYGATGHVIYYFELSNSHPGACARFTPEFRWPTASGCIAAFRSKDLPAVPPME